MKSISSQINRLDSIFPWVRKRAVNNMVMIGLPAVKEIITTLDTPYAPLAIKGFSTSDGLATKSVHRWARLVEALVKIGEPALVELKNALHHRNPNVRLSAMKAIGDIGHPSAGDLLLPFIEESKKSDERRWAILALGKIRSARVFDALVAALDGNPADVKEAAIIALGEFGDTRVLPKLELIAESDKTVMENYGLTIADVAKDSIRKIRKKNR